MSLPSTNFDICSRGLLTNSYSTYESRLAQSQGVLDAGIPAVRLVTGDGVGAEASFAELLMGGSKLLDAQALTNKIRVALDRLHPREL